MNDPSQMHSLVDMIAQRVRARLDGAADCCTAAATPAVVAPQAFASQNNSLAQDGLPCEGGGGEACDACRGCHVNKPDAVRHIVRLGAARIAAGVGHGAPAKDLAGIIDHTLLKPDATRGELKKLCSEAMQHGFATVCVNAANVRFCAAQLEGSTVKAIAVVGFPLGANTPAAKAFEAREAVRNGAAEIDMVINVGALKSGDYALVLDDICQVVRAVTNRPVKVIIETSLLGEYEKVIACALSKVAGAAFVKTSTGFGSGGATQEDIRLMRAVVGPDMGVKASGGVRTEEDARAMVEAGATRLGASASVAIVAGSTDGRKGAVRGPSSRAATRRTQSRGGY